jgi:diguanylate cyclase (GGDEF)-like protein/PAS domain S-box-containing protein
MSATGNDNPSANILIVDDEPQNRKLLEALLRHEGYATACACNGEEALAEVARQAPDLILLDIMMPRMDGYEVARILKAAPTTSSIPIIMVTALIDRDVRLAGLKAGAEEFLTKPVDRSELWLRVRNLLRLKAFSDFLQQHGAILEQQVRARTADLQRFRTAMDATADAILLVSRKNLRFIEVNATASKMFGYSKEEFLDLGLAQLTGQTLSETEFSFDALIGGDTAAQLQDIRVRRKDGSAFQVEMHQQTQRTDNDWLLVCVLRDVTEREEAQRRLHQLAHYDALTGLPNRLLFYNTLQSALALAAGSDQKIALMCIDLDHFKNVNDTLGHAIGDELLRQFSTRLVDCLRVRDTVGRLGGDEFAMVVCIRDAQDGPSAIASSIREAMKAPFDLRGHAVSITASIGITVFPDDAVEPEALMKYADTAMYGAKQAGRDTFRFFTAQMNTDILARLELEAALRRAVERKEFVLHYQPRVKLDSGRIAGLEALLRWQRPGHGLILPQDFIAALEETGLIVQVGNWVIAQVCAQIGLWTRSSIGPVQVSVNVSDRQFIEGSLEDTVIKAVLANVISAGQLELELTESAMMTNTERTIASLKTLKNQGVQISIDDFGTGYSSLAYLRRFPIDKLKIDIAFIRDITSSPDDAAIVVAIVQMAHSLKLEVVAEGVETAAQLSSLRGHQCDYIQGFHFSAPLSAPEIEKLLSEDRRLALPAANSERPELTLLLVDDEAHILNSLKRALHQDGYRILMAQSAAEGFELLAVNQVQVILCDQRMPGMNGTEFLDRVKEMYPDTLRIVLSGYTELESIIEAINCGSIYRFYTKPWDNKTLRDNIREAFHHQSLLHSQPHGHCNRPPAIAAQSPAHCV